MQLAIPTLPLAPIREPEDSDEEQGLRGLRTNIFSKISSSTQTLTNFIPAQPEQSKQPTVGQSVGQVIETAAVEQDSLRAVPHASILLEQAKSTSSEQDTPVMPSIKDLPSTPPMSEDEDYGHGVSIDSMIVTPRVLTLVDKSPNVGTNTDAKPQ